MGFLRKFDSKKLEQLSDKDAELFELIKADIFDGKIFPAVRNGELHFYHRGGCLYKFNGNLFKRDKNYEKYSMDTEKLTPYEKAKKQNENRYMNADGSARERQLLDRLNNHTFSRIRKTKVVVLDIEVCLNGIIGKSKKCDMVLLNTETNQIAFVEGKVFSDKRVNVAKKFTPEVIEQVNTYTQAIAEQPQVIIDQYSEHISIINSIFGTFYSPQICLIPTAKLLVYETPEKLNENGKSSIEKINEGLGEENVVWYKQVENPGIDEIWDALNKQKH